MTATVSRFEFAQPAGLEAIPRPTGWRVMVAMRPVENKSAGGILLPDKHLDQQQAVATVGYVVALGPTAYDRPEVGSVWVQSGNQVLTAKYAGQRHDVTIDGQKVELRIINDDEVQGVFPDAEAPGWVTALINRVGA